MNLLRTESGKSSLAASEIDRTGLAERLRRNIAGEVRFDDGSRAIYSTDASNYRHIPIGVVIPRSTDDVVATVAVAREFGAPILARGGGTSLAGQCCNVAVVMDMSKHVNRVLEVNAREKWARVEPGVVLDQLRVPIQRQHGLTFGPDPATHTHCTLGGMIGNNSCGVHSVQAGRTSDNIHELDVLTYDGTRLQVGETPEDKLARMIGSNGRTGEIYSGLQRLRDENLQRIRTRFPQIPRRVSGYNLPDLLPERGFHLARALVGSEATCVTVLEAKVRLVHWPKRRALVVLGYDDVFAAASHLSEVLEHQPVALEGIDDKLVHYMRVKHLHEKDIHLLPDGKGWLLVEMGGESRDEAESRAHDLMNALRRSKDTPAMKLYDSTEEVERIWEIRESGLGATAHVPGMHDTWPGWEDAAVPPVRLADYLRDFRSLLNEFKYEAALYGHFGDGCVHCRIDFDLESEQGKERYRAFTSRAADLVVQYGGSLSGEHGDGQSRADLLEKMYGPELIDAFRDFKRIWDPDGKMNPGKVVDPNSRTADLRVTPPLDDLQVRTHFQFPDDDGSFASSTLRCVGVGKCRRTHDAFMCPSFVATRDEKDSTRGRARALFEMLHGESIHDGWQSRDVHDTLDLCLGCKGCKKECPVDVDMATYKAEFLSHYYDGRRRPLSHHVMGKVERFARLGSRFPGVANFLSNTWPFGPLAKRITGVASARRLPRLARESFSRWFEKRPDQRKQGEPLVLFPDAFNNYFFPGTLKAAVAVFERMGYCVQVPGGGIPAIRPLIHYGFLQDAKKRLAPAVAYLDDFARQGIPIIGMEPSEVSVFRDELRGLYPDNDSTERLRKGVKLFSEFLDETEVEFPQLSRKAVFHGHCHQKAVLRSEAARNVLRRIGLEFIEPEVGCCGMAGSFGYERSHYDVSMSVARQNLIPRIREAGSDTLIIADGFSCREQIRHGTGRNALHLAEVVARSLQEQAGGRP
ncbi:MAG: FAD-binding protein [Phycisphaerae bacterium]|nr:FAD-binding protein [Phycisphaerae bacterium]